MPVMLNLEKRVRVSLVPGDPDTPSDDASCSGGDGGTCPSAPPRAREPTMRVLQDPAGGRRTLARLSPESV